MSLRPIRTLVVDDDYRVAKIHATHVERTPGYEVVGSAHTGAHAHRLIEELRPDLVLMDIYLPDRDGLAVMAGLVHEPWRPDFIVITAARDVATVRTAMQLGAVHYLVKPFRSPALADRLHSYAEMRARLASLGGRARQADVDELFALLRASRDTVPPAKGHSAPTLELVRNAVLGAGRGLSATDVGEQVGISRATAQRYLSYLARHGLLELHLKYGATGRPEHLYQAAERPGR